MRNPHLSDAGHVIAWQDGARAREYGQPYSANPYTREALRLAWYEGWTDIDTQWEDGRKADGSVVTHPK